MIGYVPVSKVAYWREWFLPRDAIRKRGLCHHAVCVSQSLSGAASSGKQVNEDGEPGTDDTESTSETE